MRGLVGWEAYSGPSLRELPRGLKLPAEFRGLISGPAHGFGTALAFDATEPVRYLSASDARPCLFVHSRTQARHPRASVPF